MITAAAMAVAVGYAPQANGQEASSKPAATEEASSQPAAAKAMEEAKAASQPAVENAVEKVKSQPAMKKAAAAEPAASQTTLPTVAAAPAPAPAAQEEPEQIVVVGSRRVMRSVLDSPTPVDMIQASDFNTQATTDMDSMLRTLVPSYNVSPQPISDAATLMRPANLRGLPPDSTVVLINGKRRHRGSVITFLGSGLADGSQGVDLAPIPSLALKRVEVLRDGAAAQYGSDAIAGVMNFVLRDDVDTAMIVTRLGSTYEGDGFGWSVAANVGLPLTERGFFNFTIEYGNTDPTDRSVQRADAQALIDAQIPGVGNPAQIWGSPEVSDDLKIFANMGLEVADGIRAYAFGNVARRDVLGGFFYRNP
ncbi:MAG: TonB-dependent receptor plug domain-containing protein, partial [Myxococcota bacterium]